MSDDLPGRHITFDLEDWDTYAMLLNALSDYDLTLRRQSQGTRASGDLEYADYLQSLAEKCAQMTGSVSAARGEPDAHQDPRDLSKGFSDPAH